MRVRSIVFSALLLAGAARAQRADSLRLELLRLAVREAEIDSARTSFWRRLLPRVEAGAGLSAGGVAFAETGAPLLLPRDSYRLSVSVPLSGILDGTPHEKALIQLDRARTEFLLAAVGMEESGRRRRARLAIEDSVRALRAEELCLREELVRYQELLFRQGAAGFDALTRARLALLAARAASLPGAWDAPGEAEP
jgi:hypothetical protein